MRCYLLLKSGVDSDLPADHRASSSAYQPVPVALAWTALYLLSVAQDVEQQRRRPNSSLAGYQERCLLASLLWKTYQRD